MEVEHAIFYEDKKSWEEVSKSGVPIGWTKSQDKVFKFWECIQELKVKKGDFNFNGIKFPYFLADSFWPHGEQQVFPKDVSFKQSEFMAFADFSEMVFEGKSDFTGAKFHKQSDFHATKFNEQVIFRFCVFYDRALFENCTMLEGEFLDSKFESKASFGSENFGSLHFRFVEFESEASFAGSFFSKGLTLSSVRFKDKVSFNSCKMTSTSMFYEVTFENAVGLDGIEFQYVEDRDPSHELVCEFRSLEFLNGHKIVVAHWEPEIPVRFTAVNFPESSQFFWCDFKKIFFASCEISKTRFSHCTFHKENGRTIFFNDNNVSNALCETYRQLKKTLIESKDWEEAGDAYKSEMVIKRKLLQKEILNFKISKIPKLLVMLIYELLSEYQQSIGRPLTILVLTVLLVFPSVIYLDNPQLGINMAVKTSLESALPLIGSIAHEGYSNTIYYLLVVERIISIILLTFFILSTRARLRQ